MSDKLLSKLYTLYTAHSYVRYIAVYTEHCTLYIAMSDTLLSTLYILCTAHSYVRYISVYNLHTVHCT
jgi:hypothetical protein